MPFHDEILLLDPSGAVFLSAARMLVVADLHFEKSSSAALQGSLLPPYDTRITLLKLQRVVNLYQPMSLVFLGDSFHDRTGHNRLHTADFALLRKLAAKTRIIWVTGNHDPDLDSLPGEIVPCWQEGNICLRHEAQIINSHYEISGHFHPKASIMTRGKRITRPCFAMHNKRLMLPAFGTYTGGLDVNAAGIASLFPAGGQVFLLGKDRLFRFAMPIV
ncbi:MAG: ligase-associated DNA damage response endonuclease PdeM [Acidocella sp.]|nr:ligase-associated DNA damage response endonuclease PdeM [Acidocella sp.]